MAAEATYDLRRQVLREGCAYDSVRFPEDDLPGAFHLAVVEGGMTRGVVTVLPAPIGLRPGRRAWRIRGMAVAPGQQRTGIGGRLLDDLTERADRAGVEVVWAQGRDSALGFYRGRGWTVEGEGYLTDGIPHHTVILDLRPAR